MQAECQCGIDLSEVDSSTEMLIVYVLPDGTFQARMSCKLDENALEGCFIGLAEAQQLDATEWVVEPQTIGDEFPEAKQCEDYPEERPDYPFPEYERTAHPGISSGGLRQLESTYG